MTKIALPNYNRTSSADDVKVYPFVKAVLEESLVTWRSDAANPGMLQIKKNIYLIHGCLHYTS